MCRAMMKWTKWIKQGLKMTGDGVLSDGGISKTIKKNAKVGL